MSDLQSVEVVFVCPDPSEAGTLRAQLEALKSRDGELFVDSLELNAELGAFKSTKIVTFALVFSSGVTQGVIGNAIFAALNSAPTSQCVIAGEPVDKSTAADKAKLETKVRASAQPHSGRIVGH
jgi:hypothetical protein